MAHSFFVNIHCFILFIIIIIIIITIILLFRDTPAAYSQARGKLELQLQVTATEKPDLSYVCKLYHSSQRSWILNALSEARD